MHQYCAAGLNFGYFDDRSPIIAYGGATALTYSMGSFQPPTIPGCRVPHVRLSGGRSLYDLLGPGYTLVRMKEEVPVARFCQAASLRRMPLELLGVAGPDVARAYDYGFVLSRPDLHVAWRGEQLPGDINALLDLISGFAK
ncbi:MAG: hypothetical protein ACRDVP_01855 [Acidimicrobiales bacterium]